MNFLKYITCILFFLIFSTQTLPAQQVHGKKDLIAHLLEFAKTSSVTGREGEAATYIQALFSKEELEKDKLGNLILAIGSGEPKILITAPLDEPGYVISQIQEDGYLKLNPIGMGHIGNLYHQFMQGHEVNINTEMAAVKGVSTVRSAHYERLRATPERAKPPFSWQEVFVDLGAASASELATRNIQYLDPVTLNKKPVLINNSLMAAPSMRSKAAAIALAMVAKSINEKEIEGTIVIAWTVLELLNGKGIEAVINNYGPFDEVHRFNRFLESEEVDQQVLLANGSTLANHHQYLNRKPVNNFSNPAATVDFGSQNIYEIGLPSLYTDTPVELIALSDVESLRDHWLQAVGGEAGNPNLPKVAASVSPKTYSTFNSEHQIVSELIGQYGVSHQEQKVRELILNKLPDWAVPEIDLVGNIILHFGQGEDHIAFVAHMDETGYVVDSIGKDGTLILQSRGGMLPWVWEAQPALVHVADKSIQGVFEPRVGYKTAVKRTLPGRLTVFAGFHSKSEALAAGIKAGMTTVTMPKEMIRLSENKGAARGFDDRVGCAALLMSLKDLNPKELKQRVTFVWSVGEEIGLIGSAFAAKNLRDIQTVYPIDTYVSSDDPYSDETFANCLLGQGAVIRVLESINFISREHLQQLQSLAGKNDIQVQYGMTAGGTDGQAFLGYGVPSVPLSWPGRYSHSPVEIMDYRDMNSLVSFIQAIIKENEDKN